MKNTEEDPEYTVTISGSTDLLGRELLLMERETSFNQINREFKVHIIEDLDDVLLLVNRRRALPPEYVPEDLAEPEVRFTFDEQLPQRLLREQAAEALEKLFQTAEEQGIYLFAVSGYRSYERQESIFAFNWQTHGEERANQFSARAGHSEHQTGLAMDITSQSAGFQLTQDFGDTEEGKWVAENAAEFGFIIRYLEGKEEITGFAYEPWHLRYVGVEAALEIAEQGITLEEYLNWY
ncbi:MAG: M15 family metallopeptidase [Bacillus sp. (in: Bacteria)]|nr:M15 family metallopeptidase [Bacillus sp. (in: firmicutes)]